MAYLNRGPEITLRATRPGRERERTFYFEGGIDSFVRHLNKNRTAIIPKPIYVTARTSRTGSIEVALQYTDDYTETIYTFANNINTPDGGTHLTGFRSALTRTLNDYAREDRPAQGEGGQPRPATTCAKG